VSARSPRPFRPAIPAPAAIVLSENSRQVLQKRYLRKGLDGSSIETVEGMFRRVAHTVAEPDAAHGYDAASTEESFYGLLASFRFFPNSPTFTGAGTPLGQLAACFVIPIADDLGKASAGIFQTLRDAALIQQTGGGNGFSFSRLRPRTDSVASSAGVASGPVGFLRVYDTAFGEVAQGGTRRGANMAVLRVDHPDILDFIRCKTVEGQISNFNISVGITDAFMQAVGNDEAFPLVNPRDGQVWRTVPARELFDEIVKHAHHNGEPGALFLDTANRSNPVPHLYVLEATNPCVVGETLIYTEHGLFRADELAAKGTAITIATDARFGARTFLPATHVFQTGRRPVYRLKTRQGYEVRLTEDHRVMTPHGWVKARDLIPGDRIHILNRRGGFGNTGTLEQGHVLGWLVGDGTTQDQKHIVPPAVFAGTESIQRGFMQALFTADGQVNDGGEKGCSVRLSSCHLSLLRDVQRLLLNFGIASRIYENRRTGGSRPMPDGKGGTKAYSHQPQHDLAISKSNLTRFANEIGFLTERKQTKLAGCLSRMVRGPYKEPFLATVMAVEPDGVETVYDLHQPDTHSFVGNGLVVHNCGEQWLGDYESCCLGSINLALHVTEDDRVDWEKLRISTIVATRFLDNVVDANKYVPAVPQLKEAALRGRRIGLGIMGLGDMMYRLRVRYGAEDGQEFAAQVMEFVRYHCMATSIELAAERGPFPAIRGSIYDPEDLKWRPPQPLAPYTRNWGRPALDWEAIVAGIRRHGIRNAAQTTVAPTGTIGTVAGCEGYGCEPVFALAYTRTVKDGERDLKLTYTSPLFEAALTGAGLAKADRDRISEQVSRTGSCQDVVETPAGIRRVFVTAQDITVEEHVYMQAALQAFVDNSISKTVNCPAAATVDDVKRAYQLAWRLGCKGLTVYVTGSRQDVVLETKATADVKGGKAQESGGTGQQRSTRMEDLRESEAIQDSGAEARPGAAQGRPSALPTPATVKRPRPGVLPGVTYRKETPLGAAYITVNVNGHQQPFEVFLNVGKAGSDVQAVSEALGRLISLVLRLPSPLDPNERLAQVIDQLAGIGGGRSLGFGVNRVRSLPDAIAQVLREHVNGAFAADEEDGPAAPAPEQLALPIADRPIGDLCPDCGQAAFIATEGCRKCYACGYSEC